MRRLLLLVAAVCVLAALVAVGAKGSTEPAYGVTLAVPPVTAIGETMTLSGTLTGDAVGATDIWLVGFDNVQCTETESTDFVYESSTVSGSSFSFPLVSDDNTVAVVAGVWMDEELVATSECVPTPFVAAEPPKPGSSFLCWNREMTNPVVYTDPVADTMWATGRYFEPQAILGTVEGGTNIGAYHLVCNAPSTMKATGEGLGGSGEVYSAATMILYHQQHLAGNDLNLYHIYK